MENIKITEKAKEYMKKKGKLQVVIDLDTFLGIKILNLLGFRSNEG